MAKPDEEAQVKKSDKQEEIGFKNGTPRYVAAPTGQGVAFDGQLYFDAGKIADFNFRDRLKDYKDQFTISAWIYPEAEQSGAIVTHMGDGPNEKDNNLPKARGYGLFFANGKVHFNLVGVWADDSFRVETAAPVPLKQWHHVIATFDATEPYEKVQLFLNGQKQKLKINNPRLFRTFGDANANLRIGGGGGPSVKPYQPAGLWKDMTFSNMTNYPQDKGEGLWRRSLYTFWKRTVLNPSMLVFDATAREFCNVRETRTNSPLQALNLMNDVTYVEAARLLAERMLKEGGATPEARLAWAFRTLTSRWPDQSERQTLLANLQAQLTYFRTHPQEAEKLLTLGEKRNDKTLKAEDVAAYATTASLLLNLDEVITKQ